MAKHILGGGVKSYLLWSKFL